MSTNAAIGVWDDARVFPLLRNYLSRSIPLRPQVAERDLTNRRLQMAREADQQLFGEWVKMANAFNGFH